MENRKTQFIYIYSEDFELCDYGKITSDKGKLFCEILEIPIKNIQILIKADNFSELRNATKLRLKNLLKKNKENPMRYPDNLDSFEHDMFISKSILGKEMKLFQGGIENSIIGLSNLYDLFSKAMDKKDKFVRVFFFKNHLEHKKYMKNNFLK